jgi:phage terminase large subunit-like protein
VAAVLAGWRSGRPAARRRHQPDGCGPRPVSDGDATTSDEFGVSVASLRNDGVGVVRYSGGWFDSPQDLAKRSVQLYHDFHADALVVERNHGGKWMPEVLRGVDQYVNIRTVWASQGKKTRAEPVAALFQPDPDHRLLYRAVLLRATMRS